MKVQNISIIFFICIIIAGRSSAADSTFVTINFAGDVTLAHHFQYHVGHKYDYAFKEFPEFGAADVSVVNLENPLTKRGKPADKAFVFRAWPEYVNVLKSGGVDIVNLANNHIYDYTEQGLFDTIKYLDAAGILHIGAGKNMMEARRPVILNEKGVKIAFLGYYGLRKHSDSHPATIDSAGTALRNLKYIKKDIATIRDSVDIIIINYHWGLEKENYPQKDQIFFAHKTIDYGADLVIGHHPHVLQGIEKYNGKYIVYSLGNFIFGGNSRKHENTAVFQAKINIQSKQIEAYKILPVEVNYWKPKLLSEKKSVVVIDSLIKYSKIFKESAF